MQAETEQDPGEHHFISPSVCGAGGVTSWTLSRLLS